MTNDLISRQAAIDVCNNAIDLWHGQLGEGIVIAVRKKIAELPSAQPNLQPTCNQLATDCISRQAAIKAIENLQDCYNGFSDTYDKACIIGALEEVPSAQPDVLACGTGELNVLDTNVGDMISRQAASDET